MSVYTQVFGGTTIYPSDVSYLAITLSGDTVLEWPLENSTSNDVAAPILDVNPTANGYSITLPPADNTGTGQTMLFNNVNGLYSFTVKDAAGGTLATVNFGEQWQIYLSDNSTAAGTWRVFRYGASTATVQPSSLAGAGLTASGSTLAQSAPVTSFNAGSLSGGVFSISTANRANVYVWTDTGTATVALPSAVDAGNGWFVSIRNEGGGSLTINPAGIETINGLATITLNPNDSATIHTDGLTWYTVGLGQEAIFAFDYTVINLNGYGNPLSITDYILTGSELNRIAYRFTGTLAGDVNIVVPATVQQYWINNDTSGSFTLTISTTTGTPVPITQGARGIYYCDSTEIINADTAGVSLPVIVSQGGTGATTASGARLNLGITSFADAIVTATTGSSVRATIGAAASGANSDITSLTGLTTPLSIAQGGTAATTASGARTSLGLGTIATQDANNVTITGGSITGITDLAVADGGTGASNASGARTNLGLGTIATQDASNVTITGGSITGITDLAVADGGTGSSTASGARTNLGATTVGSSFFTLTNPSAITFPRMNADNTVSALNAADFRTAIGVGTGTGTVTSVSGTGTVNGITLTGTVTSSGNLTLGGTLSGVSLTTQVTGTLPVANGGTGATSAATARSNLGAAASGANTDITALDQDVSITATGTIAADTIGYRGLPQSSNTTLALADAGKHIYTSSNVTIPANSGTAFPVGTTIVVANSGSSTLTISITSDTLRQAGTTNTGTRTLAAYGLATLIKVTSTVWFISGNVS